MILLRLLSFDAIYLISRSKALVCLAMSLKMFYRHFYISNCYVQSCNQGNKIKVKKILLYMRFQENGRLLRFCWTFVFNIFFIEKKSIHAVLFFNNNSTIRYLVTSVNCRCQFGQKCHWRLFFNTLSFNI